VGQINQSGNEGGLVGQIKQVTRWEGPDNQQESTRKHPWKAMCSPNITNTSTWLVKQITSHVLETWTRSYWEHS